MQEKGNQSSSSVSVLVSLVSPASPSVSLSLESSESLGVFFLGGCPVLRACIWPAMESGEVLVNNIQTEWIGGELTLIRFTDIVVLFQGGGLGRVLNVQRNLC